MGDWVSAHLDVSSQTANRLWQVARAHHDDIDTLMESGRCGLDRAAVLVKLRAAGVDQTQLGDTAPGFSLGRLYGLLDRVRTLSAGDEASGFAHRYLVIQPSLDDAAYKLWGCSPVSTGPSSTRRSASGKPNSRCWPGKETGNAAPTPSPPSASTPSPAPRSPVTRPGR